MPEQQSLSALKVQLQSIIVGQEALLDRLIIALLAGGHVLLEGPPGLAKTTVVHALASGLDASFQRVQFTPDLMPGDLTGSEIYEPANGSFRFVSGPLFHEILLADEINRAPPKVQSALLEAMAEHQVTVGGTTRRLPELFMVLATQNPLEQSGTYPLPEAQLDRFLFKIVLDYPSLSEEIEITRRARTAYDGHVEAAVSAVLKPVDLLALRDRVDEVFIEERVERFAVEIVVATRKLGDYVAEWRGMVQAGASPRASIALLRAASARAFLERRDYVLPEDVIALAPDVLRHRLVLDFAAEADAVSADDIVHRLIAAVPAP
ncbi:MAG: MoxR family ATPase [Chromatiaceae bacterium]|nr:MoxR family ATPase [Gammaproteobacteria bacterium]MCP5316504.1 MoxR family ATPase [Chromatiaceae bacterium]MCP5434189.1 MoxR family ATPase [Chromatiaceae bacterium]MCW5587991.1 MoxR family ATPase [Chromatiales bacterium]